MKHNKLIFTPLFVSALSLGCSSEPPTEPAPPDLLNTEAAPDDRPIPQQLREAGFVDANLPAERHGTQTGTIYKHTDGRWALHVLDDSGSDVGVIFDQQGKNGRTLRPRAAGMQAQGWWCETLYFWSCWISCAVMTVSDGDYKSVQEVCTPACGFGSTQYCTNS